MPLNRSYIQLLKYIQENPNISLKESAAAFKKNESSIRKEIHTLNIYLPDQEQITIVNGVIQTSLDYEDYLAFLDQLSLKDYFPNQKERIHYILLKACIEGYVNTSKIYDKLHLSLTTKKKDLKQLRCELRAQKADLLILHKKGITITGNELQIRILLIKILLPLIEIDSKNKIRKRKANTPMDDQTVELFYEKYRTIMEDCRKQVDHFLQEQQLHATYATKKFLFIYTALSFIRKEHRITNLEQMLPLAFVQPGSAADVDSRQDMQLISSFLDFHHAPKLPINKELMNLCVQLVDELQEQSSTHFYTRERLLAEIYQYLYKSILQIHVQFSVEDKLFKYSQLPDASLSACIKRSLKPIESSYQVQFNEEQIITLTLLMHKWINKNKILRCDPQKVIIVTNTCCERISYFIDRIQELFEIKIIAILDINETDAIESIDFHWIFTFSERTQHLMARLRHPSIQLNFFITDKDIEQLLAHGFSKKHHKLAAEQLMQELQGRSKSESISYLKDHYPDLFI